MTVHGAEEYFPQLAPSPYVQYYYCNYCTIQMNDLVIYPLYHD